MPFRNARTIRRFTNTATIPVLAPTGRRMLTPAEATSWNGQGACLGASLLWLITARHFGVTAASLDPETRIRPRQRLPILLQAGFEQAVRDDLISRGQEAKNGRLPFERETLLVAQMAAMLKVHKHSTVYGEFGDTFEESALKRFDDHVEEYIMRTTVSAIYCLLVIPGHAMAAAYDTSGGCFLFEPNRGVYGYNNWSVMLQDLWEYLNNSDEVSPLANIALTIFTID